MLFFTGKHMSKGVNLLFADKLHVFFVHGLQYRVYVETE